MNILFGEDAFMQLSAITDSYDKIFLLTDDRIHKLYYSMISSLLPSREVSKIVIPSGEHNKNIENLNYIWNKLVEGRAGKDALLINLGGGTISDIGGFAASCYKRGMNFVNVPTTLLAMVDASIGGKNGINIGSFKNQVGLISEPEAVIVNTHFLKTLEERDLLSGLAEMMKYAFIADASFLDLNKDNYRDFVEKSAAIKEDIVSFDMNETGLRKILNFGHTVGHAIESFYMESAEPLRHGEAVALGIYSALYLSVKYSNLDMKYLDFYEKWFADNFSYIRLDNFDETAVFDFVSNDKKNKAGKARFVLISAPERPLIDVEVAEEDIKESILILKNKFSK